MRKGIGVVAGGDPGVHVWFKSSPRVAEVRRHDGDDGVGIIVEANFLADDVGISAKLAAPETVAEDYRVEESGDGFRLGVDAAKTRLCTEQREIVRAGGESFDAFRAIAAAQIGADGPDYG